MQAIIPVAGAGTRLRPFTYSQPKALIPVAGKPIISYIIEDLHKQKIEDFVFIVGYLGDKIVDYIKEHHKNIHANFVYQNERNGLGHALFLAKDGIDTQQDCVICLGDSLIEIDRSFYEESEHSLIAIQKVSNPQNFGLVELGQNGLIEKFVEKPAVPLSNLAMSGLYKIRETAVFFEVLEKINRDNIRTNGEIQLTDALQMMHEMGIAFSPFFVDNWLDVGKGDILMQSNAFLLKKFGGKIDPTATLLNSVIIEPVSVAANVVIENSIVGPNITIGEHTKIDNSIIENGIVGSFSKLESIQLSKFVIGSDSSLKGAQMALTVGDNTDIDFSYHKLE